MVGVFKVCGLQREVDSLGIFWWFWRHFGVFLLWIRCVCFFFDASPEWEHGLAYRQQRSFGVSINLHNAGCLRVQMRHAVNQKLVSVMSAVHRETGLPGAVRMPFHSVGLWIPLVEVADNRNTLGLRRRAYKTHRNQSILCRITMSWFLGISLFSLHIKFVSCD